MKVTLGGIRGPHNICFPTIFCHKILHFFQFVFWLCSPQNYTDILLYVFDMCANSHTDWILIRCIFESWNWWYDNLASMLKNELLLTFGWSPSFSLFMFVPCLTIVPNDVRHNPYHFPDTMNNTKQIYPL